MNIYRIDICKEEDKPQLMAFIEKYWAKDHIFTKSDELFRFQHYQPLKDEYTFLLGKNTQTNELDGIIGIIPVSQYDPALEKYQETWGGIWKVRQDVKNEEIGLLGLILFEVFDQYISHGSVGMSDVAKRLHAIKKYKLGVLNQYYILNRECTDFRVADISDGLKKGFVSGTNVEDTCILRPIEDIRTIPEGSIESTYRPRKSLTYLLNRFQNHPVYQYHFWGVYDGETLKAIFVYRIIEAEGHCILRIVDVLGNLEGIGNLYRQFQSILKAHAAEYVDIVNYGIDETIFRELGFFRLDFEGEIVIPNYFEPFIRKNVMIECAYRAPYPYVIFKADSDQDRPNILPA